MFKTWSRIIGSPYLFDTLGKYVQQLQKISETELGAYGMELEMDENRAEEEGADLESNSMQLKFVVNKFLLAIFNSVEEMPQYNIYII